MTTPDYRQMGSRTASVPGLKILKCPEEGGNRKIHEDFLTKLGGYLAVTWPSTHSIAAVIKDGAEPTLSRPTALSDEDKKDEVLVDIYKDDVRDYGARRRALKEDMKALFSLLMANVSSLMKSKIASKADHPRADREKDVLWLLDTIEEIMIDFDDNKDPDMALDDQLETIMNMRQREDESNEDFIKAVSREIKIFEKYGGTFMWTPRREKELEQAVKDAKESHKTNTGDDMTTEEEKDVKEVSKKVLKQLILAKVLFKRSNRRKYGDLQDDVANQFLVGNDNYPKSAAAILRVLNNWKGKASDLPVAPARNRSPSPRQNRTRSVSFLLAGQVEIKFVGGTNNSFIPRITCHLCGMRGHVKHYCPIKADEEGNKLQENQGGATGQENRQVRLIVFRAGILLEQHGESYINRSWILLDSESSHHLFCNRCLVSNIRETTDGEVLRMHSNGGFLDSRQQADFCSKIKVWFNENSLANILSLALVTDQFRVTMDTDCENAFVVYISEEHTLKFKRVSEDLYALNASNIDMSKLKNAFNFLSTVEQNKSMFRARDVRKADEAITLHRRTNHMANDKFVRVMKNNLIRNCPVTVGDVKRSHLIYGPPLPSLKGRTRDQESPRVQEKDIMTLPSELHEDLKNVTLCVDFYYVNGVKVFHSISRRIHYRTVTFPLSRSKQSIINELKAVQQKYHARGFRIVDIHADNEFEKVAGDILPIRLQCCGTDDHVPEVERSIQTQKNEHRSVCHAMPYRCLPRMMIREIIKQGNTFLNALENGNVLDHGLTARNIVDNLPHIDYNDIKYEMGEYVQLHINEKITNTMRSRTIGAVVLGPRNLTGRYNFMSLETGAQIDGRVVARLPISDHVIERVEELGLEQQQPLRASRMLQYEWRPGNPIGDDDAYVIQHEPQVDPGVIPDPIVQADPAPNPFNAEQNVGPAADPNVAPIAAPNPVTPGAVLNMEDYGGEETAAEYGDGAIEGAPDQPDPPIDEFGEEEGARGATVGGNVQQLNAVVPLDLEQDLQMEGEDRIVGENSGAPDSDFEDEEEENQGSEPQASPAEEDPPAVEPEDSNEPGVEPPTSPDNIERTREEERQRRSEHFNVEGGEEFGRGKRRKKGTNLTQKRGKRNRRKRKDLNHTKRKQNLRTWYNKKKNKGGNKGSKETFDNLEDIKLAVNLSQYGKEQHLTGYSFLEKKFSNLSAPERLDFFLHAKEMMDTTGRTHLMERYTTGVVFASMSAKKGLEKYGREAELKLIAEFVQFIEYSVFHGVNADELTPEKKKGAANMITIIEEKLNRGHTEEDPKLRARSVYNGSVQKGLYPKEETASPTVSLDGFMLCAIIAAVEDRKKAVSDVKGAYLHASMKDEVIMKITGPEVDIFCNLDPILEKSVTLERGKRVLYVQLDKALYGCVQSALLWYDLYSTTLMDIGFVLNPYDLCVANATIDGSQCTVCWYVDDNLITHKSAKVIDDVIVKIEKKFGKMTVTKGDDLDFLGMNLKFTKGKVTISMKKHILKALNDFEEEIVRNAATPARNNLFEVKEDSEKLIKRKAENYHSVVASLLFVSRRCRLDIQTAIGFLTTRVAVPNVDDWAKLRRVLQYLRGTIELTLTIGGDNLTSLKSWVDVSYGVHADCRSHTGGCASFGWGAIMTKCQKQKLNVKSSTEGEIVGVSDYFPNIIWGRMFMEAQGYPLSENILFQDNQSSIKIVTNGRKSSGPRTKHMDNRYFWIKDRLNSENIKVVYCPTGKMLADFFTKPLQGNLFRKFRDVVLGYNHIDTLNQEAVDESQQERVGIDGIQRDCVSSEESIAYVEERKTYAEAVRNGPKTS